MTCRSRQDFPGRPAPAIGVTEFTKTSARRWVTATGLVLLLLHTMSATVTAQPQDRRLKRLQSSYVEKRDAFAREVGEIADWCESRQLFAAADEIRSLAVPRNRAQLVSIDLPTRKRAKREIGATDDETEWKNRLRAVRDDFADELYQLAQVSVRAGFASYAYQLVRLAAWHNPDHARARQVLGEFLFQDPAQTAPDYHGEWVTPFERKKRSGSRPSVKHQEFGWIRADEVEKYESGLRPWRSGWKSAEQVGELRRDFRYGWETRTNHFLVKTNVSLEAAVEIANKLEKYHAFFFQTFASFFETPDELKKRFTAARSNSRRARIPSPYIVNYYATQEEYIEALTKALPQNADQIPQTNGLYLEVDQTCNIFQSDAQHDHVLFHEATHQFFDVRTRSARDRAAKLLARKLRRRVTHWQLGERQNFWIFEGIACYMESYRPAADGATLGDQSNLRFRAAQMRATQADGYYLPFEQLTRLGMREFQSHPNLKLNYTQAAGMVHFLMHYEDGVYRDALIAFLAELYRPDLRDLDRTPSLARLTGVTYETLDRKYLEYMSGFSMESTNNDSREAPGDGE